MPALLSKSDFKVAASCPTKDPAARAAWRELLLRYCRLDTLAMVLIWEHGAAATAAPRLAVR
jgi:hypothetical protein